MRIVIYSLLLTCCVVRSDMDDESAEKIKERLGTKTLKKTGYAASGCINRGEAYTTDFGTVFIKSNNNPYVRC